MEAIYVITLLDTVQPPFLKDRWTIGFQTSLQSADKLLRFDASTIADICGYRYAVIERTVRGIFPMTKPRWFYQYDHTTRQFVPMDEPPELKAIVNFGLG